MSNAWPWCLLIGGWVVCAAWAYQSLRLVLFLYGRGQLSDEVHGAADGGEARICVIVPARDESAAIERCLISLAEQDHPQVHVVAVNDRSTDDTGAIMERVARVSDRVSVVQVETLPEGWLGKNHANWVGSCQIVAQSCDYLLFTDGDVWFHPECLRRAVGYARERRLDHLCLAPLLETGGFFESSMCQFFGLGYLMACRVWQVPSSRHRNAVVGVGAFNLVRREVYDRFNGHEPLRMEVLDDFKLGKLMKAVGGRCDLLRSGGMVQVRWQVGLGGVVRGLEKNAVAGCDYSVARVLRMLGALLIVFILPFVLGLTIPGPARWGWLVTALLQMVSLGWAGVANRRTPLLGVTFPLCAAAMSWALARAAVLTFARGGIVWRNTFYGLDALRGGMV